MCHDQPSLFIISVDLSSNIFSPIFRNLSDTKTEDIIGKQHKYFLQIMIKRMLELIPPVNSRIVGHRTALFNKTRLHLPSQSLCYLPLFLFQHYK